MVDHGVWSDWGTEELRTFASNAGEWMVSGGNVVLMGPEDDGVVGEAVLDVKGKETMREMGFQQNNVDTETEIFLGTDHTKNAISFSRRHLNSPSPNVGISSVFVINLDRRPDRWSSMQSSLSQSSITSSPTRIPASDGNTMDLVNTPLLSQLFSLKSWSYGGGEGEESWSEATTKAISNIISSPFAHCSLREPLPGSRVQDERSRVRVLPLQDLGEDRRLVQVVRGGQGAEQGGGAGGGAKPDVPGSRGRC